MSDLRISELEDIVWEFGENDDHIVPHPECKKSGFSVESSSSKRPRLELRCSESNIDNRIVSDNVLQRKEGPRCVGVKEEQEKMLSKSTWTHSSSGGFCASLDGNNRKNSCSTFDEERTFDHCMRSSDMDPSGDGLCADDSILDNRTASMDNNLFQYQLNNATQTESDLGFFGNDLDDKESTDLLFYGWSEIENFEDVDRMFRSCDSTFGLDMGHNDELGWFSSSHVIEGSNDATKPSLNFSGCGISDLDGVTEQQEVYGLDNNGLVTDGSNKTLTPVNCKRGSQKLTTNGPSTVMNTSYVDGSWGVSGNDNESQILSHVSESKHQKPSEGKRKEPPSENGVSFIHFDNLNQAAESNHLLNFQCSSSSDNHQPQEASHSSCVQTSNPLIKLNNSHSSNQLLPSMSSIIKSEDSVLPSISPMDSSYASTLIQSVENTHDFSLQKIPVSRNKKKERQHQRRISEFPKKDLTVQRADLDPVCPQKLSDFENKVEGQSDIDGDVGVAAELDCSNIQESSCMSSVLDEVSIDASSFQQLQNVMEKLDLRTKLCIRDSLYRLARSAERRHKCDNPSSGDKDEKDTSGSLLPDGSNKCTGFMDMETDTNPIDRSIAHLLFHRPSDPSATAPFDTLSVKSHTNIDQAHNHGPSMAEKQACQEETTSVNGEAAEH